MSKNSPAEDFQIEWRLSLILANSSDAIAMCYLGFKRIRAGTRKAMQDWQEKVTVNPDVCHGKACIRGTRIMVTVILDNLADGLSPEKIIEEYPPLTLDDILAAISYAATLTREEEILPLR